MRHRGGDVWALLNITTTLPAFLPSRLKEKAAARPRAEEGWLFQDMTCSASRR